MVQNTVTLKETLHNNSHTLKEHLNQFVDQSTEINLRTDSKFKTVLHVDVLMDGEELVVKNSFNQSNVDIDNLFSLQF